MLKDLDIADKLISCEFCSMDNQLDDFKIFIGILTRQTLKRHLDNCDIGSSEEAKFYKGVRQFYIKATQYVIATYP